MRSAKQPIESPLSIILAIAFAIMFVAELYLFAATASIYDSYQPGITSLRMRLHPIGLLLFFAGGSLMLGLLWRKHRFILARFSEIVSLVGGIICLAALLALLVVAAIGASCEAPLPTVRELEVTLRHALGCPTFSGRSGSVAVYGGILSALLYWGSRRLRRRT